MPASLAEQVAHLALDTFDKLPSKCRPRTLADSSREWTPMSAVILHRTWKVESRAETGGSNKANSQLEIVALATGSKSVPVSTLPKCAGLVLHDCHAEILACRGFNYWLLCEMQRMLQNSDYISPWLSSAREASNGIQPFRLRDGLEIYMFSTEAPCGDASMELLVAAAGAKGQDTNPWPTPGVKTTMSATSLPPPGRGYFSELGKLRRKPARADAEISMSKSCTDKLMLKQFTSILGFPADLLVDADGTAFLKRLVVYEDQYCAKGYKRAFADEGRLHGLSSRADCLSVFFEISVLPTGFRRFEYEKGKAGIWEPKRKASNISALWVAGDRPGKPAVVEVLVNGVKQGYKQLDSRCGKGSVVCRRLMLQKAAEIMKIHDEQMLAETLGSAQSLTYNGTKGSKYRRQKVRLKQNIVNSLGGWPSDHQKDDFPTNVCF